MYLYAYMCVYVCMRNGGCRCCWLATRNGPAWWLCFCVDCLVLRRSGQLPELASRSVPAQSLQMLAQFCCRRSCSGRAGPRLWPFRWQHPFICAPLPPEALRELPLLAGPQ